MSPDERFLMSAAGIILLLILPAAGVCAGYAAGGRLTSMRFRANWLLLLAASFQAAQYYARRYGT
ncbi:MAG TPA: hypothetical protein VF070_41585 [Streptosporangiaceae bacterium]